MRLSILKVIDLFHVFVSECYMSELYAMSLM